MDYNEFKNATLDGIPFRIFISHPSRISDEPKFGIG